MQVLFEPSEVDQIVRANGLPVRFEVKGEAHDTAGNLMMLFSGPIICEFVGGIAETLFRSVEPPRS